MQSIETCQIFRIVQLSGIYGNIRKPHPWAVTSDLVYCHKSLTTAKYNYCIIYKALDTCKSGFNMSMIAMIAKVLPDIKGTGASVYFM